MTRIQFSANISIMFTEYELLQRPAAAAAAGFDQVEMWWPFSVPVASETEVDDLIAAIHAAGVRLSGLNFYAGDMPGGERGVASHPDRAEDLQANIAQVTRIAEATGCRLFNLLYGQRKDEWSDAEQDEAAESAIRSAAAEVAPFGGTVLIEPLAQGSNGAYPLTRPEHVVNLLVGPLGDLPNVRLLYDLFHLGSNGYDIVEGAAPLINRIGHVQVADAPGRGEPGSGNLPISRAIRRLIDSGYNGVIACEYKPTDRTEHTLSWMDQLQ